MRTQLPILGTPKQDEQTLLVSGDSVFFTTQGEGKTMGEPAVFLRTNECNLDCRFCDTPYTWQPGHPSYNERTRWTVDYARQQIVSAAQGRCSRMVLTGGEPLLQQSLLAQLANGAEVADWDVEIETNGTIVPEAFRGRGKTQINCSPKLANSGIAPERRIRPAVLREMAQGFNTYYKFVVGDVADVDEIEREYLPHLKGLPDGRIFLSPEGVTVEAIDQARERVAKRAAELGFVLGDRQHIRLYGNKRKT
ncbi:MAG TPA: 7-carboxy-7-deazaguanine synthase QueE [Candidatus Peribacteria bacterium]|nr:7-carboxy-7-deazaguanine synthase QueE [Candidatus Peribacteria bacterium]